MNDFIAYLISRDIGDVIDTKYILNELGYALSEQRRFNEALLNRINSLEEAILNQELKINKDQGKY